MEFAEKVIPNINELKDLKKRTGVGKCKHECEDLVMVYTVMDAEKRRVIFQTSSLQTPFIFQHFK